MQHRPWQIETITSTLGAFSFAMRSLSPSQPSLVRRPREEGKEHTPYLATRFLGREGVGWVNVSL
jgi:hypothetical protein